MKNRVVTRYYGLQDMIQVSTLILDDAGTSSLHAQLKEGVVRLQKNEVEIMRMALVADDYNEEKQGFFVFFIHPPVQHHLFVTFDVELFDGRVSTSRTPVSLRDENAYDTASNPVIPVRPAKDYANAWDAEGRNRSPI
jgi:hypothetical protein